MVWASLDVRFNCRGSPFYLTNLFCVILNQQVYIFAIPIDSVAQLVNVITLDNQLGTVILPDIFNKNKHQLGTQKLDQIAFNHGTATTPFHILSIPYLLPPF